MPPVFDAGKCDGCGICDLHCPIDVIAIDEERRLAFARYSEECWHCGSCRQDCPTGAVDIVFPKKMLLV
ncbi:MAG: 4Fe-4S binding protein [Chloroflexi bacterium]|nr:4Fe-4S binding protein [Chloroflexota bacterium]